MSDLLEFPLQYPKDEAAKRVRKNANGFRMDRPGVVYESKWKQNVALAAPKVESIVFGSALDWGKRKSGNGMI